jgi:hypothetical protein
MRILLTNHQLSALAGSELLTFELARESIRQGHEVSVFTFFPGHVSERISHELGVRVFDPTTLPELKASEIDVIHAVHWPTYLFLKQGGFDKPAVFGFLGVLPALENPPPLAPTQDPIWWGVSEEVIKNVSSITGWISSRTIEPIRNWAIEIRSPRTAVSSKDVLHFGVVSNHFPEDFRKALLELSVEMNFQISFIGLPDNPQVIDLDTLLRFDAIISLGRTAITAICNGIPTLVLDHSGLDGWVTQENYRILRQKNFSGRTNGQFPNKDILGSLLTEVPSSSSTRDLAVLAAPNHDLTTEVSKILALCEDALDANSLVTFPRSSEVALEYLERSFRFEATNAELLNSGSWRMTRGLRAVWRLFRGIS